MNRAAGGGGMGSDKGHEAAGKDPDGTGRGGGRSCTATHTEHQAGAGGRSLPLQRGSHYFFSPKNTLLQTS